MTRLVRLAMVAAVLVVGMASLPASAAFQGENGRIVYASNQTGYFELYSVNPDGSDLMQLTNLQGCSRGAWVSPDGTRIAFHSTAPGAPPCTGTNWQIYTINADGSGAPTKLTSGSYNAGPAWSPDGTRIAFVSNRTGSCQIWSMNADGSNPVQLSHLDATSLGGVSWSPDGSAIVYGTAVSSPQCPVASANLEIHVLNLQDGTDRMLESEPFIPGIAFNTSRHPDWSPDGSQITYASTAKGNLDIWTMNADGSGQKRVTNLATASNFSRFSPDGQNIVFETGFPSTEIRVVKANGGHEDIVADGNLRNVQPAWGALPEDD